MKIHSARFASMISFALCFAQDANALACVAPMQVADASPQQVVDFFKAKGWKVVTFVGYSGAEYEQPALVLKRAGQTLDRLNPRRTAINIGATAPGIGAVYALAKQRGFTTTGIVSSQARDPSVGLSPCVDFVFYVSDPSWGGLMPGTTTLSPTSEAMVRVSDALIGIGGGEVARDELVAAKRMGKRVKFFAADMNHRLALEKAAGKGLAAPTDFRGAAHGALSKAH